jgi:hypothetical protein
MLRAFASDPRLDCRGGVVSAANTAAELAEQWRNGNVSTVLSALDDLDRSEAIAVAVYLLHYLDNPSDSAPASRFMRTLAALC